MPMLSGSGVIGAASGRPDGLFANAIYASDVKDLRNDANKVTDKKRLLEKTFNSLVAGEVRGFEGETFHIQVDTQTTGSATSNLIGVADGSKYKVGDVCFVEVTAPAGVYRKVTLTGVSGTTLTMDHTLPRFGGGDIVHQRLKGHSAETILHCDIIGDPANYFRGHYDFLSSAGSQTIALGDVVKVVTGSLGTGGVAGHFYKLLAGAGTFDLGTGVFNSASWQDLGTDRAGSWVTEGVFGTPLLVDENGGSLIPDGSSKSFKMSRKVATGLTSLFSDDNGNSWTSFSLTSSWLLPNAANAKVDASPVGRILCIFYTTKANPTELATNAEVLALGDVHITAHQNQTYGAPTFSNLIGKVLASSANGDIQDTSLTQWNFADNYKLYSGSNWVIEHGQTNFVVSNSSPAVKVLPYLTRENGRGYLNLLYKEMVWDTTVDSVIEFTDITEATTTKTAGVDYHVTDGAFEGFWQWKNTTASPLTAGSWLEVDGVLYNTSAGTVYATRWDGNGWGDNNKFTVLDNESTETDDNGNTVIIGTKRIELLNFIGDSE